MSNGFADCILMVYMWFQLLGWARGCHLLVVKAETNSRPCHCDKQDKPDHIVISLSMYKHMLFINSISVDTFLPIYLAENITPLRDGLNNIDKLV